MATEWLKNYPKESLVQKAYSFATEAHKDAKRTSGDPYISHCLAVAETVHNWHLDQPSIAAALLHDVVEDTTYSLKEVEKKFGSEVAFLVDGLTKLDTFQYREADPDVENLRKLIVSFSRDLRVLIIKLADRWHNTQTLKALSPEKQKRFALETRDIYAPLAYRLGMQRLSGDLEDLSFPYLEPKEYEWLTKEVKEQYHEREDYAEKIKPILTKELAKHNIKPILIDSRAKHYSSLYKKLLRHDMNLNEIYDLVALRVIVRTVEECYAALGIVHHLWSPLPNRIKDYIARPKSNGYRSIHTTVFCMDNKITEFQIRTQEMHEEAEIGIAAHWAYEQAKDEIRHQKNWTGVKNRKELLWVEQLRNWQKNFGNQKEFVESLKVDFFKDRIFVVTPENDVIDLPVGATPVDFAYRIHSDIGNQCIGAKVNNRLVTLDRELQSGDIVQILTQKGKKPSNDWLRFIKTAIARHHIKSALREKQDHLKEKSGTGDIEFKILNQTRPGYLKDVTKALGEMKININFLNSKTDQRSALSTINIKTEILAKSHLEQLLIRLKKIAGTKEINYKINR